MNAPLQASTLDDSESVHGPERAWGVELWPAELVPETPLSGPETLPAEVRAQISAPPPARHIPSDNWADASDPAQAISRLSHTHEQILNWLILNPEKSLRQCADTFGYSQPWLSRLLHSDLFQARLRDKQDQVFSHIAQDIPAKLRGLADIAIERVTELVAETQDPGIMIDIFDKTMHRLGYAPSSARSPSTPPVQQNVFVVSQSDLASARETVISGALVENPSPRSAVGEVLPSPSAGVESLASSRTETPRGEV